MARDRAGLAHHPRASVGDQLTTIGIPIGLPMVVRRSSL
jgi:hypothetical protein